MYLLYNSFGFQGIYVLTLIITGLIVAVLFGTLVRSKNGIVLSFFMTIFAIVSARRVFAARNQIFSFLIFLLEIYCLQGLLEKGKKRYFWYLLLLAFALVNFHDTVYPLYFVMIAPYLAEVILNKIFKLENSTKFEYSNLSNIKYLIILILLAIGIGFLTPVFGTAYTNLVFCMNGVSTDFIGELQPVNLISEAPLMLITFLTIAILCFSKAKIKIRDVIFTFGFIVFALIAQRNLFFLYLIGIIFFTNILTSFINTYVDEKKQLLKKLENSIVFVMVICSFTAIIAIFRFSKQLGRAYVNSIYYPVEITEWMTENIDCENMRLWTHFDWGSYLELKGIKVFVDSRSGMYTEQENPGVTVLADWLAVQRGNANYQEIFEKYNITHILVENTDKLKKNISNDENYELVHQDNIFSLYRRK